MGSNGDRRERPQAPPEWPLLYPPTGATSTPLSEILAERLLAQRVVLLHGPLDDLSVTRASAELMTLDAEGDDPVTLRVDSGDGGLAHALTLMDVIELMGVPVHALCLGQVGAGAVGVVAVCARRSAMPSTRFALREPAGGHETVHVRNAAQWAEVRAHERDRFCVRVAAATGRTVGQVREDISRGRFLDAGEAVAYGLVDEVCRPDAEIHRLPGSSAGSPGQPMGFRPQR
jgi:ATP-dependent Clp protease protease subunit